MESDIHATQLTSQPHFGASDIDPMIHDFSPSYSDDDSHMISEIPAVIISQL